jgi:putative tricarboxylic transport membrane protein
VEPSSGIAENEGETARRFNFNTVFGVVFFILSIVLFLITPGQIEKPLIVLAAKKHELQPMLFPQLIAAAFCVLGVWLFFRSFSIREDNQLRQLDREAITNVLVTVLAMAVYGPLMMQIGFVVASSLVIAFMSTFFGNRNYILTAIISVAVPVTIFFIFTKLLATYLPPFPIDTVLTRLYIL